MTSEQQTVEKIGAKIRAHGDCGEMFCDADTICTCRDHSEIVLSVIREIVFEEVEKIIDPIDCFGWHLGPRHRSWDEIKAELIERLGSGNDAG